MFRSVVSEAPLLKNPRLVVSVEAVGPIPDVTDPFDVPTGFAYLRKFYFIVCCCINCYTLFQCTFFTNYIPDSVSVTDGENKSPCIHGNAFYEFESPITEVNALLFQENIKFVNMLSIYI